MKTTRIVGTLCIITNLAGCGNPGGVSDEFYAKYKQLGRPKLLCSCTTTSDVDVGYVAGIGAMATYNKLLRDTQAKRAGKLEIIEAEK